MDYSALQFFVPAFMIVFVGMISLWAWVRKNKTVHVIPADTRKLPWKIRAIDFFYKVLLILSLCIAIVYGFFPRYYYLTGPIEWLDNPVINIAGVLILKASLIWIVIAQFNIERTIALINSGVEPHSFSKLLTYAQKLILTGMLIMFLGFFVTISSALAIIIFITAIVCFEWLNHSSKS